MWRGDTDRSIAQAIKKAPGPMLRMVSPHTLCRPSRNIARATRLMDPYPSSGTSTQTVRLSHRLARSNLTCRCSRLFQANAFALVERRQDLASPRLLQPQHWIFAPTTAPSIQTIPSLRGVAPPVPVRGHGFSP